ncbi:MAG: pseudouridine-5'-phosphate glycosidase [Bacillota bacterium]
MGKYLQVSDEVRQAVEQGQPVVAFETAILTHGLPRPWNVQLAKEVEAIARSYGVVPATTAVFEGKLQVGLSEQEIEFLGTAPGVRKASSRDLPISAASGGSAGTTVAASIILAEMAGIRVFVTGGLGGVHRGAQTTFDISADLVQMARSNIATVCAGVKSILDTALTMEVLETLGVPVIGYGTDVLPGFHVRSTPHKVLYRADGPDDVARIMKAKWEAGIQGGILVGVPVPEEDEIDRAVLEHALEQALREAEEKGVQGKEITPYLLARIGDLTGGATLNANLALVRNNTRVGCAIARSYSALCAGA